jgi:hypothetical protein
VTVSGTNLVINIPSGSYLNGEKYCIVIAQSIPTTATINMPVVITIGSSATQYPLTNNNCSQVTACGIRTRTRYATHVVTSSTGGTFRLYGSTCCTPNYAVNALPIAATSTTSAEEVESSEVNS